MYTVNTEDKTIMTNNTFRQAIEQHLNECWIYDDHASLTDSSLKSVCRELGFSVNLNKYTLKHKEDEYELRGFESLSDAQDFVNTIK